MKFAGLIEPETVVRGGLERERCCLFQRDPLNFRSALRTPRRQLSPVTVHDCSLSPLDGYDGSLTVSHPPSSRIFWTARFRLC
jgi:hypothetical protein